MKINAKLILLLLHLLTSRVSADISCQDNSYHLTQKPDNKRYHTVSCNCPCSRYKQYLDRGKCEKCSHYRDPGMFIVLRNSYKQAKSLLPAINLDLFRRQRIIRN